MNSFLDLEDGIVSDGHSIFLFRFFFVSFRFVEKIVSVKFFHSEPDKILCIPNEKIRLFVDEREEPTSDLFISSAYDEWKTSIKIAELLQTIGKRHRMLFYTNILPDVLRQKRTQTNIALQALEALKKIENIHEKKIRQKNKFMNLFLQFYSLFDATVLKIDEVPDNEIDFSTLTDDKVCSICFEATNVEKCTGHCGNWFHQSCLNVTSRTSARKETRKGTSVTECVDCRRRESGPLVRENDEKCETCQDLAIIETDLIRCVKCPTSFHKHSKCIPAGTVFLNQTQIVCPSHKIPNQPSEPMQFCWSCDRIHKKYPLAKCSTCPISFHCKCLRVRNSKTCSVKCVECDGHRRLFPGTVVFAKKPSENSRWWPALILPNKLIAEEVRAQRKSDTDGSFCVRFFGTEICSWHYRSEVFLFEQASDTMKFTFHGRKQDLNVTEAIRLAELHKTNGNN